MKNLIIIGAGGMGRTVYDNALESVGYGETFVVKGFIDDSARHFGMAIDEQIIEQ